jgi:hypothetical protein
LVYVKSFATASTPPLSKIKQQVINNIESESIMTNTSEILKSREICGTEDVQLLSNVSRFLSDDNSKTKYTRTENTQKDKIKKGNKKEINKSDEDQIKRLNNLIKSLKN